MKKKHKLLALAGALFISLSACTTLNEDIDKPENPYTYFSYDLAVKDGKVLPLLKSYLINDFPVIDDAVSIYDSRFVLCNDGKIKDIYDSEARRELYPTNNLIDELNESCGIWKIERPDVFTVKIYANDGKLYEVGEVTIEEMASNSGYSFEEFLQTYDPNSRVKISDYEKTEQENSKGFTTTIDGEFASYKIVLNDDSTVSCMKYSNFEWIPYDGFPELSEWKNIVDIVAVQSVIIGLQADGKVLSLGTDFSVDNAVKIDIITDYYYNIPVALTSDGKLVFGNVPEEEVEKLPEGVYAPEPAPGFLILSYGDIIKQAEQFTDVVDFAYIVYGRTDIPLVILAQKSDGTLIATTNDVYNPEYVSQPEDLELEKDDLENPYTFLDSRFAVIDGKILYLSQKYIEDYVLSNASQIDNAVSVIDRRFVLCDDGTYKDLYETPESVEEYPTVNIINTLNSGCGIYKITRDLLDNSFLVYIYANDGTLYTVNEMPKELFGQNDEGYEAYIREHGPITHEDRLTVSSYDKIDNEQQIYRWIGKDMKPYTVVLNKDGTVLCDYYPEVSQWKNVKDLVVCKDMILGLTENGKVLSVGTDFSVENAVKIDIITDYYNIPVALTADGKLVFGDSQYFADILTQASEFTDIVDFTYYDGSEFVILAQKSDGSLIATTNDLYNPEYVSQPE